jgi:hypothetical protein
VLKPPVSARLGDAQVLGGHDRPRNLCTISPWMMRSSSVINFLGFIVFAMIVGIGLMDRRSGLSVFAMYRSASVTGVRRRASLTERRGDGNQPRPPAPAR